MCGRYLLRHAPEDATHSPWEEYWRDIQFSGPRYNICPSQSCPVIRYRDDKVFGDSLTWGFKPAWSKYSPSINARAEGVFDSKMFKPSILHKRCLIIADGFYEPKGESGAKNRPWYCFRYSDDRTFTMAGIWTDAGFAIITCEPNSQIQSVHDRMPVIIEPEHWSRWLDPQLQDQAELTYLLQPHEYAGMESLRVGDAVKKPGREGPECMAPVPEELRLV